MQKCSGQTVGKQHFGLLLRTVIVEICHRCEWPCVTFAVVGITSNLRLSSHLVENIEGEANWLQNTLMEECSHLLDFSSKSVLAAEFCTFAFQTIVQILGCSQTRHGSTREGFFIQQLQSYKFPSLSIAFPILGKSMPMAVIIAVCCSSAFQGLPWFTYC